MRRVLGLVTPLKRQFKKAVLARVRRRKHVLLVVCIHFVMLARALIRSHRKRVLFFPRQPSYRSMPWKAITWSGYKIIDAPNKQYDAAILWDPSTVIFPSTYPDTDAFINGRSIGTSKENVQHVFEAVFGYPLAVDPLVFAGECVVKSNDQGTHDGKIIVCPIENREPGKVYEKLIETEKDGIVWDLRVPFIGGEIPFCCLKYRPANIRFSKKHSSVRMAAVHDVFSVEEVENIRRFAGAMGVDMCEFDMIRESGSGLLYIVDTNTTPQGPPGALPLGDSFRWVRSWSEALRRLLVSRAAH